MEQKNKSSTISLLQVSLSDAADESDSVESNSSEEGVNEEELEEPEQPEITETDTLTDAPNIIEQTEPPATIDLPVSPDPSVLPSEPLDPQSSADPQTDTLQLIPDEPPQTSLGVDVSQDMPETDPAHDSVSPDGEQLPPNADTGVDDTTQINDVSVNQDSFPSAAPFPPYVKGNPTHFSVVNAVPVAVGPGVPICFMFQYASPEPNIPRGDSYWTSNT